MASPSPSPLWLPALISLISLPDYWTSVVMLRCCQCFYYSSAAKQRNAAWRCAACTGSLFAMSFVRSNCMSGCRYVRHSLRHSLCYNSQYSPYAGRDSLCPNCPCFSSAKIQSDDASMHNNLLGIIIKGRESSLLENIKI